MSCPRCMGSPGLCPECEAYLFGDSDPKKAMTQQEALMEARKRWGESAYVKTVYADSYPGKMYRVLAQNWMPMGSGDSWEAAFADADRRANEGK